MGCMETHAWRCEQAHASHLLICRYTPHQTTRNCPTQDVQHAFPSHPWLQSAEGRDAAKRVLLAFVQHNPKVGYTRPLSHIVALLLVALNRNQVPGLCLR